MDIDRRNRLSVDDAKDELASRGMPFSEEYLVRYVRSGRVDVVALYLDAGISPDASIDGESALAVSANHGHEPVTRLLLAAGANPMGIVDGLKSSTSSRDGWGRLSSLSGVFTFVSSLLIAAVGWHFTNSYNERQLALERVQIRQERANKRYQNRLAEMQTVEKLIPHLTKDEPSKQVALIAISVLASGEIATKIAELYEGQGSIDALEQIARTGAAEADAITALTNMAARETDRTYKPAHQALASVFEGRAKAIVRLHVPAG